MYAISKKQLVSLSPSIDTFLFNTADDPVRPGEPGFTVWPSLSPDRDFAGERRGTEFFVSSNAVFDDANADSLEELILWAMLRTSTLDDPVPSISLVKTILDVDRYAVPSNSAQKPGTIPLADCLEDTALSFLGIANCGLAVVGLQPVNVELGTIDSGDSRVLDVRFARQRASAHVRQVRQPRALRAIPGRPATTLGPCARRGARRGRSRARRGRSSPATLGSSSRRLGFGTRPSATGARASLG